MWSFTFRVVAFESHLLNKVLNHFKVATQKGHDDDDFHVELLRSDGYQLLPKFSEQVVNIWWRDQGKCLFSKPTLQSKNYLRLHGGSVSLETKALDLNHALRQSSPSYKAAAPNYCRVRFELKAIDYLRLG